MSAILEWHALSAPEVLARMESRSGGLSAAEAQARLARHGPNALVAAAPPTPWAVLARQFRNAMVIILLVAIGLSVALGHGTESVAIAVIVAFAVLLGFVQEYRAERSLEALRELAAPVAHVLRDGAEQEVPAREVVPGDVLVLRTGDRVPADARLLESVGLELDEAVLTGESAPVEKQIGPLSAGARSAGDRVNMVFGGTAVAAGRGSAVVVATGAETEFGRIAHLLGTIVPGPTPLQVSLDRVGAALAKVALAVVAVVVGLGWIRGGPPLELLLFGLALAVAVVPEALPAVVTISLALGVQRLARRNALVRRLPAAETLGTATVICSDKTGTLTRDEMTVREVRVPEGAFGLTGAGYEPRGEVTRDGGAVSPPASLQALLAAAALDSDARLEPAEDGTLRPRGDPTEAALLVAARKAGLELSRLAADHPRIGERPFTSERKAMTTLHRSPGGATVAFAKGAPEVILRMCSRVAAGDGDAPCDPACARGWLDAAQSMAARAMRVLAVARRPGAADAEEERGFTLLGLVGMMDPPRAEVREAVRRCGRAGIRVIMITGDHPATARAVAGEIGLPGGELLTGAELARLSDAELTARVEEIGVYARVAPADKLRVVEALQRRGHVLAMTGDGVNDAPALKRADIGIAMGRTGTDVSREAAAMVLTDDDFTSIVGAVEEARIIFANVRKYLMYLLSSNAGEIGLMAATSLLGLPLPLSAIQLLYVNLATDGLPALALAVDPPEGDVMDRPPRRRTGVFSRPVVALILAGGAWSTLVNTSLYAWALGSGRPRAEVMTLTFVALVLMEFAKAFVFRSDRSPVVRRPLANRWLDAAVAWELLLLGAVVYVPALQRALGTRALPPGDLALALCAALTVVPVVEGAKALVRRGLFGASVS